MRSLLAALMLVMISLGVATAAESGFTTRTRWVMGTALTIHLPAHRADADSVFNACFEVAERWDGLLSPWKDDAPLTRLSRGAGSWITVPGEVLEYLARAAVDAGRTSGVVDLTLTLGGVGRVEIDRDRSRARVPVDLPGLDPGADGKGVALDGMTSVLDAAGVAAALVDFGGSSFLARGDGPDGAGWNVALTGAGAELLGTLNLRDIAASVSSTVQRRQRDDGTQVERFHLVDLNTGDPVRDRRTVVVLASSASDAEVLSTAVAIVGAGALDAGRAGGVIDRFPDCTVGLFEAGVPGPRVRGDFDQPFTAVDPTH